MQFNNSKERFNVNKEILNTKIPELTLLFWVMKICATTLGETGGDLLSMTLDIGYSVSTMIFFGFFLFTLSGQLKSKKYTPVLYWSVIVSTSTAGTTMSDYMDRTLGLGYTTGSAMLVTALILILALWYYSEKSLSVTNIKTFKGELFYWIAILFSNTLGTALGDFLADDSGLGFLGSNILISSVLVLVVLAYYYTKISRVVLFWIAFVLTRPFGATFGDVLTKLPEKGGLDLGAIGASLVFVIILAALIIYESYFKKKPAFAEASVT